MRCDVGMHGARNIQFQQCERSRDGFNRDNHSVGAELRQGNRSDADICADIQYACTLIGHGLEECNSMRLEALS